jgi:NAD dependent epimerase/dehydratase family enzyme
MARCPRSRGHSSSSSAGLSARAGKYMSWIHVDDWVEMVRWALITPSVQGPINVTAPAPVTNA